MPDRAQQPARGIAGDRKKHGKADRDDGDLPLARKLRHLRDALSTEVERDSKVSRNRYGSGTIIQKNHVITRHANQVTQRASRISGSLGQEAVRTPFEQTIQIFAPHESQAGWLRSPFENGGDHYGAALLQTQTGLVPFACRNLEWLIDNFEVLRRSQQHKRKRNHEKCGRMPCPTTRACQRLKWGP